MSKKSVEDALQSLLPTYPGRLPSELINLALSLLDQSRSRASSLKQEEEIARSYACANIACERLKASLNLPRFLPRPPCPPRVYKKLYRYLENALPTKQPKRQQAVAETPTPVKIATPSKTKVTSTPISTPRRRSGQTQTQHTTSDGTSKVDEYPSAAMSVIRRLCKQLQEPQLAPHLYTGLEVVYPLAFPQVEEPNEAPITPRKSKRASNKVIDAIPTKENVHCLIIALYLAATVRVHHLLPTSDSLRAIAEKSLAAIGLAENLRVKVDQWLVKSSTQGWTSGMEWFENLPEEALPSDDEEEGHVLAGEEGVAPETRHADERGGLQKGLGTMMQERNDWLSDDKRLNYAEWKTGILERVEAIELGDSMDID